MIKEIFKTIKSITLEQDTEEVLITFTDGSSIRQFHEQDCCENVWVSQVDGMVQRHIGAELYSIEEKEEFDDSDEYESCTWTFYSMKTSKGYLDWRWQGVSNGYYSESVEMKLRGDFVEL
jgi:hypothetical protein